jgi:hypothetical protein
MRGNGAFFFFKLKAFRLTVYINQIDRKIAQFSISHFLVNSEKCTDD